MKALKVTEATKQRIVALMKDKGITRPELRALLGAERDSTARNWVTREIKPEYPVICTSHAKRYIIASKPEHLELAKLAARENHRKATTLHRNTNVLDRWIIRTEVALTQGSLFREELNEVTLYGKFKNESFD